MAIKGLGRVNDLIEKGKRVGYVRVFWDKTEENKGIMAKVVQGRWAFIVLDKRFPDSGLAGSFNTILRDKEGMKGNCLLFDNSEGHGDEEAWAGGMLSLS
jgi:hypothetical protein